jgi:hypothetical protein
MPCDAATRRAATTESPKGDGCGSEIAPCEAVRAGAFSILFSDNFFSGKDFSDDVFSDDIFSDNSGSRISFSARRPRRILDFTVPTLHSRTSATSS